MKEELLKKINEIEKTLRETKQMLLEEIKEIKNVIEEEFEEREETYIEI